jgi:hypothetical protein
MVEEQKQNRLGRGLSALLGETDFEVPEQSHSSGGIGTNLPIEFLEIPTPYEVV